MPSFKRASTASAARATISASASAHGGGTLRARRLQRPRSGDPVAIPRRSREKSCVPSLSITDFSPLCPPALPARRSRICPNGGRTRRDHARISPAEATSYLAFSAATEHPAHVHERLRLREQDLASGRLAFALSAPDTARLRISLPARRASSSTTMKPQLWRVHSYSGRGCPVRRISLTCYSALLFRLALLDHFGFGRLFGSSSHDGLSPRPSPAPRSRYTRSSSARISIFSRRSSDH